MNKLSQLTRHFVIATKLIAKCPSGKTKCKIESQNIAKAALVLETIPQIMDEDFRLFTPELSVSYMGEQLTFDTEELYQSIERIMITNTCKCTEKIILRSNDGITVEDPNQQHLID